jgi:hypothetical protein
MRLTDALFYWLQLRLLADARPGDQAARDSLAWFAQILTEDHRLTAFDVSAMEESKVYVTYTVRDEEPRTVWFDREAAEQLMRDLQDGR